MRNSRLWAGLLGVERCTVIDRAEFDVDAHCPNAVLCADPVHIVAWATDALDHLRRDTWNTARHSGLAGHARDLKGARYPVTPPTRKRHENREGSEKRTRATARCSTTNQDHIRAHVQLCWRRRSNSMFNRSCACDLRKSG